jgi:hypothetical protein
MPDFGFVYIWRDRHKKMFYIGSHWGNEHDGYICSSTRMLQAYGERSHDFRRRIIKRIYTNRADMLAEENRLLKFIQQQELGRKYYNNYVHREHWSSYPDASLTVAEKVSKANKGRNHDLTEEARAERGRKIAESKARRKAEREALGLPARKPNAIQGKPRGPRSEESKAKQAATLRAKWESGEYKGATGKTFTWTEERKAKVSKKLAGRPKSEEAKKNIGEAAKKAWAEGKFANRKTKKVIN